MHSGFLDHESASIRAPGRLAGKHNAPRLPPDTSVRTRLSGRYARRVDRPTRTPTRPSTEAWTTRRLLAWMGEAFTKKGLEAPRLQSELLLAHVIGCERLRLYMEADRPASPLERDQLRDLVSRALAHEPVQYLVGEGWFFSLPFHVDRRVLIPRPATETIVQHVLQHARVEPGFGGKTGEGAADCGCVYRLRVHCSGPGQEPDGGKDRRHGYFCGSTGSR